MWTTTCEEWELWLLVRKEVVQSTSSVLIENGNYLVCTALSLWIDSMILINRVLQI